MAKGKSKSHAASHQKRNIQDVAKLAGVSIATVSRAYRYPELVAEKTRERVDAAARELHYAPNAQARSLRTSRTQLVVALVPDIANPFFSEVIRGAERVAKQHGYSLLLGDTQNTVENEQRCGDMLSSHQVDGMLTMVHRVPTIRSVGRPPIVNTCEPSDDKTISSVLVDNVAAFREGVSYLTALGHRHIAFIGGRSQTSNERREGFDQAMEMAGLTVPPLFYQSGSYTMEAGNRLANLVLSFGEPVTAFACVSDQMAIGVMQAVKERGLQVPSDVSVLGCDDIAFARYTEPPLSTIALPREKMGSESMAMLLELINDRDLPQRNLTLPTQLVIRGSTAPPR